jgi:hypothetical protein
VYFAVFVVVVFVMLVKENNDARQMLKSDKGLGSVRKCRDKENSRT